VALRAHLSSTVKAAGIQGFELLRSRIVAMNYRFKARVFWTGVYIAMVLLNYPTLNGLMLTPSLLTDRVSGSPAHES
jgi:hypothetical protein